jgi:Flp pilus assembly protein TadD
MAKHIGGTSVKTKKTWAGIGLVAVALVLSACQANKAALENDALTTASTSAAPSFTKTEALASQWKSDPSNLAVTLAYAKSLESLGQKPTQIDVLRQASAQTQSDAKSQSQLGRALLAAGEIEGASENLARATALNPRDAQALSAYGATLDQQTRHVEAREKYKAALALAPNDMGIVNNMAMSFALQGKLPDAENLLRKAISHPNAKSMPRVRQNLALVVGLQGRFDEAKKIASEDLPPDQVQANMDYLQQMMGRQNTWAQLKDG